jgi:predicted site-specific integrase-resolvase
VIVAYKDRLTRFGFELIDELIKKYSKGKIVILNEKEEIEPEEELVKDVMSILNVYIAKMNGLRKYNKVNKSIKK